MSTKRYVKINNRTGDKITTTVSRTGSSTNVRRDLKKSDGAFGTRLFGTDVNLSDKTYRKG